MFKNECIELNISERPIIGFTEFNIIIDNISYIDEMANYIQQTVRYILTDFHKGCSSYNLFFYYLNGKIICKVVPRFVVSPLYVGYKIPQVSTKLEEVKIQLTQYFTKEKDEIIHKNRVGIETYSLITLYFDSTHLLIRCYTSCYYPSTLALNSWPSRCIRYIFQ